MKTDEIYLDYREIDNLIHSRIRLALMAVLTRVEDISFNDLKHSVNATDGNLSTHLARLQEAGYISVHKTSSENKTESRYQVTQKGLSAFASYIIELQKFIG
ncbi:transcriptional regulator [Balneolaceae bacterium ANBcel3]|nr:transcriptional regulator [Balneolaceae bacterium ANBcel3]